MNRFEPLLSAVRMTKSCALAAVTIGVQKVHVEDDALEVSIGRRGGRNEQH
jgi:hypothetical protein